MLRLRRDHGGQRRADLGEEGGAARSQGEQRLLEEG